MNSSYFLLHARRLAVSGRRRFHAAMLAYNRRVYRETRKQDNCWNFVTNLPITTEILRIPVELSYWTRWLLRCERARGFLFRAVLPQLNTQPPARTFHCEDETVTLWKVIPNVKFCVFTMLSLIHQFHNFSTIWLHCCCKETSCCNWFDQRSLASKKRNQLVSQTINAQSDCKYFGLSDWRDNVTVRTNGINKPICPTVAAKQTTVTECQTSSSKLIFVTIWL